MSVTVFITWQSYCGLHQVFKLLCPKVTPASSLLSWCYTFYMFSPCPPSAGLQKLWSLIFRLSARSSLHLSLHPPQPLCLSSASIYFVSLPQEHSIPQSLYWPLSPYLSSHRSLQSRQCTFSVTVPRSPSQSPSLSLSPSVHWTWINSSQCSPWQRGPQSVTPTAWGTTMLLWHCHISVCHAQTCTHKHTSIHKLHRHTPIPEEGSKNIFCVLAYAWAYCCIPVYACVLCVCLCQKLVCISTLLHAYVPPAVQISVVCGAETQCTLPHYYSSLLFYWIARNRNRNKSPKINKSWYLLFYQWTS